VVLRSRLLRRHERMGLIDIATRDTDRGVTCGCSLFRGQQIASLEFIKINNYVLSVMCMMLMVRHSLSLLETLEEYDEGTRLILLSGRLVSLGLMSIFTSLVILLTIGILPLGSFILSLILLNIGLIPFRFFRVRQSMRRFMG
jgi:hypothetical protein